ncbi:MAG: hypothetical protein WC015_06760 [Methanoregula sp.]
MDLALHPHPNPSETPTTHQPIHELKKTRTKKPGLPDIPQPRRTPVPVSLSRHYRILPRATWHQYKIFFTRQRHVPGIPDKTIDEYRLRVAPCGIRGPPHHTLRTHERTRSRSF